MATKTIKDYTLAGTIDPVADLFLMEQNASTSYLSINRNILMGVTGQPADISTIQTFTNKIIGTTNSVSLLDGSFTLSNVTDPTKRALFSLAGITTSTIRTYTLPNASSTLVDLITVQTLTNKTFTAPVITGGTISNSTITVDSIAGFTSAATSTIAGLSITSGVITTANSVTNANLQSGIQTSKFSNPYKFSANRPTAQAIGAAASTTVVFTTKDYDTGTNYSTSTGLFTASIAGFYHFDAVVSLAASSATVAYVSLYKNGTEFRRSSRNTVSVSVGLSISADLQLLVSDTVDVRIFTSVAFSTEASLAMGNYFNMHLISGT